MSRVQLALNVTDLEASIDFYRTLFGVEPHKRRPGYANFVVVDPPLKLVLIETDEQTRGEGTAGALNHLGVEVDSAEEFAAGADRLRETGLITLEENATTCCYAEQDKVWLQDPARAPWEVYVVTDDDPANPQPASASVSVLDQGQGACCS
ncbi:glyoxalase/bleomycin resistance/dioxygenase family protein [Naumannella sp. ID2617S]|nr:glyoxalase/bleomycin resistance/dioxygenase family protein [Naumannella sp. ID2617S]